MTVFVPEPDDRGMADAEFRLLTSLCRKPEPPVVSGALIDVTMHRQPASEKTRPNRTIFVGFEGLCNLGQLMMRSSNHDCDGIGQQTKFVAGFTWD